MKKSYLIILFALLLAGCSDDVWLDHSDPRVYIPKYGFSINKTWLVESNEYTIDLSAYCSGVRPENQNQDIAVTFTVDPELITTYNKDITQQYSGEISELPSDCYSFTDNKIIIPKGKSHGELPIKIDLQKVKALGMGLNEIKYAIPVRLATTSHYNLQENENMLGAIYCIVLDEPSFYFWDNRETDLNVIAKKVVYSENNENDSYEFRIAAYGLGQLVNDDYTINLKVDEEAVPSDGQLLAADAYEFPSTVTFTKGSSDVWLPVKIINNKVEFRKTFYLPIKIESVSKYAPHPKKSTLLLKIEIKNDAEWKYSSKMAIQNGALTANIAMDKSPVSLASDLLMFTILNSSKACYNVTGNYDWQVEAYINYSMGIKIIPTSDKRHYNVELIHTNSSMTGKNWYGYQSPKTLELDPEKDSYYDWDYETFYLHYRYRQYDDPDKNWIYITEILEAQ